MYTQRRHLLRSRKDNQKPPKMCVIHDHMLRTKCMARFYPVLSNLTTWEPHFLLDRDTRVHCSTVKLLPETVVRYPHGLLTSCFLKVISTYISTIDSARRSWIESDQWWPHWKEIKCSDFGHHSHLGVFLTLWHLPSWSTDKYTNANTLIKQ